MATTEELVEQLGYLREEAAEIGDDADRLVVSYQVTLNIGDSEEAARDAFAGCLQKRFLARPAPEERVLLMLSFESLQFSDLGCGDSHDHEYKYLPVQIVPLPA